MSPGETTLQRIVIFPYCVATYFVSVLIADFDDAEAGAKRSPVSDAPELVLMMEPPPASRIIGIACLIISIVPRVLTIKARSQTAASICSIAMSRRIHSPCDAAALLSRMSRLH